MCLDLTRNALQYIDIGENWHFPREYHKVGVVFSQGGRMGYPVLFS